METTGGSQPTSAGKHNSGLAKGRTYLDTLEVTFFTLFESGVFN